MTVSLREYVDCQTLAQFEYFRRPEASHAVVAKARTQSIEITIESLRKLLGEASTVIRYEQESQDYDSLSLR